VESKSGESGGSRDRRSEAGGTLLTPSGIPGGEGTGGGIRKRRVGEAEGGDGESREDDDSKKSGGGDRRGREKKGGGEMGSSWLKETEYY
jgi:hypothetical protein